MFSATRWPSIASAFIFLVFISGYFYQRGTTQEEKLRALCASLENMEQETLLQAGYEIVARQNPEASYGDIMADSALPGIISDIQAGRMDENNMSPTIKTAQSLRGLLDACGAP